MSAPSELKSLVKQLQSASNEEETIGILKTLKKEARITEGILRESKAGLAVGKLRNHVNKEVSDLAKEIVKKWKTAVEKEKMNQGSSKQSIGSGSTTPKISTTAARKPSIVSNGPDSPSTPMTPTMSSSSSKSDIRNAKTDLVKMNAGDTTRDKCAELIYDALASDSAAHSDLIVTRAKGIEAAVLSQFGGTSAEYKSKIRSLFVNLKDKNNPGLREAVVSGDLPVGRFAKMTSQEMASEERKAADNKIIQDNLFKTLGAEDGQAETDAFQCGRCKQRKCRYRQAQTRSADEPMTTFVTCTVCNHRWKFS